ASVNRGAKAITLSGGARTKILFDGMSRAPAIWTPSIVEAVRLVKWVEEHFNDVKREAESTTRHGKLKRIDAFHVGNIVWLRFVFEIANRLGINVDAKRWNTIPISFPLIFLSSLSLKERRFFPLKFISPSTLA
ncbi:MAG TPA: hypothetical protein EYP32_04640, partial [Aquificaceae bacterium]|nr:hypothetical protein [Aquificaceae bacterium]